MSAQIEKVSSNKVKFEMKITPERFEEGLSRAFIKNKGRFNVPGFRKGKAPRAMVERYYGDSMLFEDAFDLLFPEEYENIVADNQLEPVSRPDIDIKMINREEGIACTVEVYVKPDVELGQYKGVKAEKAVFTLKDEDIDAELNKKLNQNARWVDVDRPVKEGDRVIIDYSGSVDDVKFEGGTAENQTLEIGSGTFIPGFEEQLIGMVKGEEKDINVNFPEDYPSEDLKGKAAVFHIVLHDIKEKEIPALDDEFAKDISEFETLDELKADIRKRQTDAAQKQAEAKTEDNVLKVVVEGAKVDIPDVMCENQIDRQISQIEYNLMVQGITLDNYLNYVGMKLEDLREQQKQTAYNMVKTQLVLEAVMKKEEISASDADVEEYITSAAEKAKKTVEEYKKLIGPETMEGIKDRLSMDKTISLIMDSAQLTEEEAPKEKKTRAKKEKAEEAKEDLSAEDAAGEELLKEKKPRAKKEKLDEKNSEE